MVVATRVTSWKLRNMLPIFLDGAKDVIKMYDLQGFCVDLIRQIA